MHDKPKPVPGRLVLSKAGRDAGRYYVIIELAEDPGYVMIADGALRKIERPKKKKLKHLHMTPIVLEEAAARLRSGRQIANGELYNMIQRTGRGRAMTKEDA